MSTSCRYGQEERRIVGRGHAVVSRVAGPRSAEAVVRNVGLVGRRHSGVDDRLCAMDCGCEENEQTLVGFNFSDYGWQERRAIQQ